MEKRINLLTIGLVGAFGISCMLFLLFFFPYHLFLREQMQLFLLTSDYLISYFEKPAALSCLLSDFFTQFFYFRGGGPMIIALVLTLEWCLISITLKKFNLKKFRWVIALIPVLMELFCQCRLYATLTLPLTVLFSLSLFLFYIRIRKKWLLLIIGIALLPVLYIFTGYGLILFCALYLVYGCLINRKQWLIAIVLFAASLFIPKIARSTYLLTTAQAYTYPYARWSEFFPDFKSIDFNREKILSLDCEGYFNRWDHVERLANKYQMKNTTATYFTNIALGKRGALPDSLLHYYQPFSQGLFLPVNPHSSPLTILFSNEVFFQLGDMNMAQHSAMLGMIFSPTTRSSRILRRLSEINMINGDKLAAIKYLNMLQFTLFHKNWASKQMELLACDTLPEDSWLAIKRKQIPVRDVLRKNGDYITALELLIESDPGNKTALDYLLCYYLLNKDISNFINAFDRYAKGRYVPLPRIYSEALLIKLAAVKAPVGEIQTYGIPPEIVKEFMEYTQTYESGQGSGASLQEKYGSGYWFYFHFAKMSK